MTKYKEPSKASALVNDNSLTRDASARNRSFTNLLTDNPVSILLRWTRGGNEVFIAGEFSNWEKIPMQRSGNTFTHTLILHKGKHTYKFIVDGVVSLINFVLF